MARKIISILVVGFFFSTVAVTNAGFFDWFDSLFRTAQESVTLGAPVSNLMRNILPETTNRYDLGTSTVIWKRLFVNYASTTALNAVTLCLDGDTCRTTWPTGGSGTVTSIATTWPITGGPITTTGTLVFDGLSTTSPWTNGQLAYVNTGNRVTSVA